MSGNLPLEQLSEHNINVAAFYERGRISARFAYNWRSEFLLTSADVIFPYFPIFNDDTGQLDGSIFFSITEEMKIGVQAVNLTNEVTRTLQQFTVDGLRGTEILLHERPKILVHRPRQFLTAAGTETGPPPSGRGFSFVSPATREVMSCLGSQ